MKGQPAPAPNVQSQTPLDKVTTAWVGTGWGATGVWKLKICQAADGAKQAPWQLIKAGGYCSKDLRKDIANSGTSLHACQDLTSKDPECGYQMYSNGEMCRCIKKDEKCDLKDSSRGNDIYETEVPATRGLILDFRGDKGVESNKWKNQISYGPDADIPGGVTYDATEKAFTFPGKGQVITVPLATNPMKMADVSYSAWVKPLNTLGTLGWVLTQYPDYGWSRSVTISDGRLGGTGVTPGGYNSGMGNLALNQWSHVVGVWSGRGGPCAIYNNGRKYSRSCSNGQGSNGAEKFIIGGRGPNDSGHNPKVMMTNVLVYSVALTDAEVKKLYDHGK